MKDNITDFEIEVKYQEFLLKNKRREERRAKMNDFERSLSYFGKTPCFQSTTKV